MKKLNIVSLVFLSLFFIPLVAGASLNTNLSYGLQNNSDVKELQEYLIGKGFLTGSATGNFYSLTLNAVKKYQASQNLSKSGYVGILTRTAINKELASSLSASNQEATTETGTTPPTTEPKKTTNDVVSSVLAQIALLQKQLDALNTQQTTTQQIQQQIQQQAQTIQQIQQNTQQIVQNTTPIAPQITVPIPPTSIVKEAKPVPVPTCTLTGSAVKGAGLYVGKLVWTSTLSDKAELWSNTIAGVNGIWENNILYKFSGHLDSNGSGDSFSLNNGVSYFKIKFSSGIECNTSVVYPQHY